jgi:hypothetical protein
MNESRWTRDFELALMVCYWIAVVLSPKESLGSLLVVCDVQKVDLKNGSNIERCVLGVATQRICKRSRHKHHARSSMLNEQ